MVGMTSWHMLVDRARIKPGQTVLIMGGTSAVGMVVFKLKNYMIALSLQVQATNRKWTNA